MKKILLLILALFLNVDSVFAAETAILVNQPAYHSMNFYVFKPEKIPGGFFATYDGYLVYKNSKGIWLYASAEKSGITKTEYIVGSVLPSVVKLKPYNAKISSVAPVLTDDLKNNAMGIKPFGERISSNENVSMPINSPEFLEIDVTPITAKNFKENKSQKPQKILYTPPAATVQINYAPVLYNSSLMQNSKFTAVSKWQNTVDRIGVLESPKTPVAWKGDYPLVIYIWNGIEWMQLTANGRNISALNTLRRKIYNFTVNTNKLNALNWNDNDTNILSQYAAVWHYKWLGTILVNKEY